MIFLLCPLGVVEDVVDVVVLLLALLSLSDPSIKATKKSYVSRFGIFLSCNTFRRNCTVVVASKVFDC